MVPTTGVSAMEAYEIRLINADGSTALLYVTQCASDADAIHTAQTIKHATCERFEIWRGLHKIAEGPCAKQAPDPLKSAA
jgi:hypothetical protein